MRNFKDPRRPRRAAAAVKLSARPAALKFRVSTKSSRNRQNSGGGGITAALRNDQNSGEFCCSQLQRPARVGTSGQSSAPCPPRSRPTAAAAPEAVPTHPESVPAGPAALAAPATVPKGSILPGGSSAGSYGVARGRHSARIGTSRKCSDRNVTTRVRKIQTHFVDGTANRSLPDIGVHM